MEYIRDDIANGKLKLGFNRLRQLIRKRYSHFRNEADLISNRISRIRDDSSKGIISQESKNILWNQVTNDVLELISKIEEQEKAHKEIAIQNKKFNFFLYVSQTKVNMLFQQMDYNEPSKFTIFQKVKIIKDYLTGSNQVGNIDQKKQYIIGQEKMNWGYCHDYALGLAFFGYKENKKKVALIGSKSSMIGEVDVNEVQSHSINYYTYKYINRALNRLEDNSELEEGNEIQKAGFSFDFFHKNVNNKNQEIGYLAKVINKYEENGNSIIIGSPIYITLEE